MPSHKGEIAKLNYGIGFSVDQQSAAELKQIINQLTSMEKANGKDGAITGELKESVKIAQQLKEILNSSWNSKLGQFNLDKINTQIKQAYGNISNLRKTMVASGPEGAAAFNKMASSILNTNNQIKQSSQLLDKMALTFANTVRFSIASSVFQNITGSIQKAWDYSVKLDTSLNDIRIVTGKSADEMERFAQTANKAAQKLGTSTKDYTDAALIYYQQGLGDAESQKRAEITMKTANVTGQTGRETSEQLTAIWNGYKVTAEEAELYIDKVAKVAATSAADLEEMATGMSKVASAANSAGVDIDQLNASLATVISVTREAPETIGSAFKTIYARLGDLSLGKTDEEGVGLGKVSGQLHNLGVEILDQEGNMRQMGDVIEDIAAKWQTWTQAQRQAAAVAMAGKMQYSRLIALFDNWDKYTQYLNDSATAAGTLNEQEEIYLESTAAHLQKLQTEAEKTYDILFDTNAVNIMADSMRGLLGIFNTWLEGTGGGLQSLTVLASGLGNIFSKQIGSGIARMVENYNTTKANRSAEELKQSLVNEYQMQGIDTNIDSARINEEYQIAKEILGVKQALTQEEYQQLTDAQKKVGELAEQVEYLEKYKEISIEILNNENATISDYEERAKYAQEELDAEKQKLSFLTREKNLYQRGQRDNEDTEGFREALSDLGQRNSTSMEQFKIIEEARMKIIDGEELSQKEIQTILEAQTQALKEQEQEVNRINQGLEGRKAEESGELERLRNERDTIKSGILDDTALKQRRVAIQETTQAITSLISIITSGVGVIQTFFDPDLNSWEKFSRISTTLISILPMLLLNLGAIKNMFTNLAIALGATGTAEEIASAGALKATVSFLGMKMALWEVFLVVGLIAAAITALGFAIKAGIDYYNKDAIAAQQAAEAAQKAQKAFEDAKAAAESLKTTISDYTEALSQLKDLKVGTEEYAKALETANEKAKELIETFGLYDEAYTQNGMILFKDNSLEDLQKQADMAVKLAEAQKYTTQISANQAKLRSDQTDLRRDIGLAIDPRGVANDVLLPVTGSMLAVVDDFKGATDKQVSDVVETLSKLKKEQESEYIKVTRNNEALTEWIRTTYKGNYEMELLANNIGEQVDGFKQLIESTEELTKANKYYMDQLNKAELEKTFGSQIEAMSKDKYGNLNQAKYQQMLEILNNAPIQEQIKEMKQNRRNIISSSDLDKGKTWSHEFSAAMTGTLGTNETDLNKYLDEQLRNFGVTEQQVGKIKDNETLAREYAKSVLKMTETQVNAMQFVKDKLKDAEGNEIVDVSNAEERGAKRAAVFSTGVAEAADTSIDNMSKGITQTVLNLENQLQINATKAGEKYGADFSMALLNSLSSPEHKIDLTDITGLDPDEAKNLANMSQEDFMKMFGLSQESLQMVGDATIEELYQSFKKSASEHEWDIDKEIAAAMSNKESDLETFGSDLSKKKFADLQEDVQVYAKNLMKIADSADDVGDSLKYDADTAVEFAFKVIKMNKAIDTLADNMQDWVDIINKSSQSSQEYAEAMYNLSNALADVYDTEADYISHSFIKKHLSEIQKIATGDEKAIENLRDALSEDIVANIIIENKLGDQKESLLADFVSLREQAQAAMSGLVMGDDITVDDTNFVNALNQLIEDCQMTVEQANAVFSALGIEPTYETEVVQQKQMITPTQTKHEVIAASTKQFKSSDGTITEVPEYTAIDTVTPLTPVEASVEVPVMALATNGKQPKISGIKKAPTGSYNNYSSKNKGGKSPGKSSKSGGGGGSQSKPSTEKKMDKQKDPYHDVNIQLALLSKQLDKVQKQRNKLFGSNLINNLNNQLNLLNKQIDTTNEKMRIARSEQERLGKLLAGRGAIFNPDGTIANYAELYDQELAKVNAVIDYYNSLSKEAQEEYKDTLDKTKEDFSKFEEQLKDYDNTVSSIIPDLEADIQDALDKQIEINIEKFNMEIKIRLDMKEAEKDWLDFKKKVIDQIKDDDIFGNATANLAQWKSYYEGAAGNIIEKNAQHLRDIMGQLDQINANGTSEWYGDNQAKALEDLQTYYKEVMTELEDMQDLAEEIEQSYLDMMDEAKDKLDEQVALYEQINDIIEHDKKVIELIYGEDSYNDLAKYYEQQHQNNLQNLDFQKREVDFWKQQMDAAEEGTDRWEKAKENWMEAVKNWNSMIEDSITTAKDAWVNAINEIFQELNNKVTNGLGLDYVTEEWDLINKNADQYLDTINSLYGIQKIQNKYLDALDQTDSITAQKKIKDIMNEEVKALQEKDKLTKYDIDRAELKYQIALKQIALEEAQQNKSTMRLRRDSQGNYSYQFVEDQNETDKLRDELSDLYNQLYNFDLDHYKDNLNQILETWTEYQEKMAEAAQINDPELRAQRELLLQEQYGELINGLVEQNETVRLNLHESGFNELADLYHIDRENFQALSDEERDIMLEQMIPQWDSGVQHMAETFAGEGGFEPTCEEAMGRLNNATQEYEDKLRQVEQAGGISFDTIRRGTDETIRQTEELIYDNEELINKYEDELQAIQDVIDQLKALEAQYAAVKAEAIAATEAAYKYWQLENSKAAEAANKATSGGSGNTRRSVQGAPEEVLAHGGGGGTGGSGSGDGIPSVGDTATYLGGTYYYDSYGSTPSGNRGPGKKVTITQVKNDGRPYPIHVQSNDSAYGWLKLSQLSGYRSGGYTGDWGDDSGRLALLHRKEMVLNADDTSNMLNALDIMKTITSNIGADVLSKLAHTGASMVNREPVAAGIEQNVTINADFPDVRDAEEIKEAFNNLMNIATMRVNRK